MALILSLETSSNVCSVAIHNEGKVLATSEVHIDQSHASKLAILIEDVLKNANVNSSSLTAVAISSGPGSYTGLRIGVSTAKGLCYALNIPLIAIPTLDLLTSQMNQVNFNKALLCPMLDARRMEIYCQIADSDLALILPTEAKIIDESSFSDYLADNKIIFFGNGSSKCADVLKHTNALYINGIYPTASHLGIMALEKYNSQAFEDLIHFEPFYLKDFIIEKSKSLL